MNKRILRSKMALVGDNSASLARHLGISNSCLSAKMNCYRGSNFTQKEMASIIEKYNLSADDIAAIFFSKESS